MKTRKKMIIDGMDKEILRILLARKEVVTRQIAKSVGLTATAIVPRLNNLMYKGYIKKLNKSSVRCFRRKFKGSIKKIKSPRYILWSLDIKK